MHPSQEEMLSVGGSEAEAGHRKILRKQRFRPQIQAGLGGESKTVLALTWGSPWSHSLSLHPWCLYSDCPVALLGS